MEPEKTRFAIYTAIFVIIIALTFWVIKPFILAIIGGVIIAYIFYPLHKWLLKRIKSRGWSAFIVAILIVIIFTAPVFFIAQAFAKDAYVSYVLVKQRLSQTIFSTEECTAESIECSLINSVRSFVSDPQFKFYIEDSLNKATQLAINKANEIIIKIPALLLRLFVLLFVVYYALKDGEFFVKKAYKAVMLKKTHYEIIIGKIKEMINSTIYGMMLVAFIQGVLAGIGYFIFGVKSPVLLGVLTALAALIPVVGTAIVWGPTVIIYFFNAMASNDSTGIALSLGLLAYSIFPVSIIDNFIRPKIIGDKSKTHPILVLLGILGGVATFGFVGILLGPIIITLFVTFIDIYHEERLDHEASG